MQLQESKEKSYRPVKIVASFHVGDKKVESLQKGVETELRMYLEGGERIENVPVDPDMAQYAPTHVDVITASQEANVEPLVQRFALPPNPNQILSSKIISSVIGEVKLDIFFNVHNETVDRWDVKVESKE